MALNELDDLYREAILDHSRKPRHQAVLDRADITASAVNPFCGDETSIQVALESGRVSQVGGRAKGCAISQASRSMLTQLLIGQSLDEIDTIIAIFQRMMRGREPSLEEMARLGDVGALEGVRQFPVRIKCALLAWSALEEAIEAYPGDEGA